MEVRKLSIKSRLEKLENLTVSGHQGKVYIIEHDSSGVYKVTSDEKEELLNKSQVEQLQEDKNNIYIKIEVI